jgi:hypothetical protein
MLGWLVRRLAIALAVGFATWLVAAPACAQTAIAEKLYQEGSDLARAGNFQEACPKFQASYELDAQVGTLMALAACHVEIGKTASAWAEYNEAASLARRQDKPALADEARKSSAELRPKLSLLKVQIDNHLPNMIVNLDGKVVPRGALTAELPIDPGNHELNAEAPGHEEFHKQLTVPTGPSTTTVRIPPLKALEIDQQKPVVISPGLNDNEVIGYTVGALGLAGVALGTVFGILATVETNNADENCINNFCTQQGLDGHDRALAFAHISTISFAVGGAGLGAGLILILTAPDPVAEVDEDQPEQSAWMFQIGGTW